MEYTPQDTDYWVSRPGYDGHQDWRYEGVKDWIEGYKKSIGHAHREGILDAIDRLQPLGSLLEIGCSVGPNLHQIHQRFPRMRLVGIDPNEPAVEAAHEFVPGASVIVGDARKLASTFEMKSFDVVLADASLMYITPEEIEDVMDQIALVAKKAVIIVERDSKSKKGSVVGGVWGRDYETLLKERGFKVNKIKMEVSDWPLSENWQKHGYYYIAVR